MVVTDVMPVAMKFPKNRISVPFAESCATLTEDMPVSRWFDSIYARTRCDLVGALPQNSGEREENDSCEESEQPKYPDRESHQSVGEDDVAYCLPG